MRYFAIPALLLIAACQNGEGTTVGVPGDTNNNAPFAEISADTVIHFTGTEPFWGGKIDGERLTWTTPDNINGEEVAVSRFAGRGGLNFSGTLAGQTLDMAVTPGECSDGMSDRTYPLTATVKLGVQDLNGCAWREGDDLGVEVP